MFRSPIEIDLSQTIEYSTPSAWAGKIESATVPVVALVDDVQQHSGFSAGWCTYESTLGESPEIEFISGGINTKTPAAVGIWRQGNLLHFGFEQSPAEMNDVGDAMLINAIHYIARFAEDRPILFVPSPFAGASTRSRDSIRGWLERESYPLNFFESAIDASVLASMADRSRDGYKEWFDANRTWLRPGEGGLLTIDDDLKSLGAAADEIGFFDVMIEALRDRQRAGHARRALERYAPEGPGAEATAEVWTEWVKANRPYLFFSEYGGYRWYVDPLAKSRGIPTTELRGPKRADTAPRDTP